MEKKNFKIETMLPNEFAGYSSEENWNGWACPAFEKEEALKIVEAQNRINKDSAFYDEKKDAFVFKSTADEEIEIYSAEITDGRKLYPIGSGNWIWEESQ